MELIRKQCLTASIVLRGFRRGDMSWFMKNEQKFARQVTGRDTDRVKGKHVTSVIPIVWGINSMSLLVPRIQQGPTWSDISLVCDPLRFYQDPWGC